MGWVKRKQMFQHLPILSMFNWPAVSFREGTYIRYGLQYKLLVWYREVLKVPSNKSAPTNYLQCVILDGSKCSNHPFGNYDTKLKSGFGVTPRVPITNLLTTGSPQTRRTLAIKPLRSFPFGAHFQGALAGFGEGKSQNPRSSRIHAQIYVKLIEQRTTKCSTVSILSAV